MHQLKKQFVGAMLLAACSVTALAADYSFRMYVQGVQTAAVPLPPPPPPPARTWPKLVGSVATYDETTGLLRLNGASGTYVPLQFDRGVTSGKHYFEMTVAQHANGACTYIAALPADDGLQYMRGYFCNTAAYPTVGLVLDMDTNPPTTRFLYQGELSPSSGTIPASMTALGFNLQRGGPAGNNMLYPGTMLYGIQQMTFNFGQRPWVYTPPAGYDKGWAP